MHSIHYLIKMPLRARVSQEERNREKGREKRMGYLEIGE